RPRGARVSEVEGVPESRPLMGWMSWTGCGRTALSSTTLHSEARRPDGCSSSAGLEPLQTDLCRPLGWLQARAPSVRSTLLTNGVSLLQTKPNKREGHEARAIGLKARPLDQHIEGGHGERKARLKIRPAPMHHLFEMTDERQHGEHRLHQHAILPLAALTEFQVGGVAFRGMKACVTQDNHALFELPYQPMVLVFYKLDDYTSILPTKFSSGEGTEAIRVGLETMPRDQHIEGRHGEREMGLKIRPAPVHHLLEMAHERQHREHRLHEHTVLPLAALTQFEIRGITLCGME